MKAISLLILASISMVTFANTKEITREEALKIGQENGGGENGKFWFERGDASPPFTHGGQVILSRSCHAYLRLDGDASGVGVDSPYSDGSQTRLDFFTSANGKGWFTVHVLKPEIEDTRPKPPRDKRTATHKALSSAAELSVSEGDLDFLSALIKRGLQVNEALDFEDGDTLLHEAAAWRKPDIIKFLLENGADPTIRNRSGEQAIEIAIKANEENLCKLLSKSDEEDPIVGDVPSGIIEAVLPHRSTNEVFFVSWNNVDPAPEILAEVRKTLPHARPASRMETLERRPTGAHSWYQDRESKEFGTLIQVSLQNNGKIWGANVRTSVGPIMAGGGWKGKVRREYGHWYKYDVESWDE